MYHQKTKDAAKGLWKGILEELGIPKPFLSGRHCPCPLCGGKDRFRFDNKERNGTWICQQCGAGDGLSLAIKYSGLTFVEVASKIDTMLGNITADTEPEKRVMTDDVRTKMLRKAYLETVEITEGCEVDIYLKSRGVGEKFYPKALRFNPSATDGEGGVRPTMVAMVGVHGQSKYASMHRTFLEHGGKRKAIMTSPRKMMPGELTDGACVMLSEYTGGSLGIAEGIETAMSASVLFEMPVWAAINTSMLKKWSPPEGCKEVVIFADNDKLFSGQSAAYQLANKLAIKEISVIVRIPESVGEDWNDVLMKKKRA